MLNLRQERHLAHQLHLTTSELHNIAEAVETDCTEFFLIDPAKPDKKRTVLNISGRFKHTQLTLLRRIFKRALNPTIYSHGGVSGRHIKSNAEVHGDSIFGFTCDISNFYPSIRRERVYRCFVQNLGCSPDVASLLTRLCTYDHHLALGLPTSPILADQILKPIDLRIAQMAEENRLSYSRFVDDITLSGSFDFNSAGFRETVGSILRSAGFDTNRKKDRFGRINDSNFEITAIKRVRGHMDVTQEYYSTLCSQLESLRQLGLGEEFDGPYYTRSQMLGKIEFVGWINRHRRAPLRRLLGRVSWKLVQREAMHRGLIVAKKQLIPK